MLANPSAKFSRPRVHIAVLTRKAFEHRSIAIIPEAEAAGMDPRAMLALCNGGRGYQYLTRSRVTELVDKGEMRWVDKHHNGATYMPAACGTWQKAQSGPVATMQMLVGAKGRYVPVGQREPAMAELALVGA